ncbi:MAG: hypothetical protein WKG01_35250 [Kofleriaceae bacterium]
MKAVVVAFALAGTAHADRPVHGSAGIGGAFVAIGSRGDRLRGEAMLELKPRSRFGGLLAWRTFDQTHDGIVMAGVIFEAAAARPRLVIDLHGELGFDLDTRDPAVGGGIRTTLGVIGPLGVALDAGLYAMLDDLETSRLQLATSALVVARW